MSNFYEDFYKTNFIQELEKLKKDLGKIKDEYGLKDNELPSEVQKARNNVRLKKAESEIEEIQSQINKFRKENVFSIELIDSKIMIEKSQSYLEILKNQIEEVRKKQSIQNELELNKKKNEIELLKLENEIDSIKQSVLNEKAIDFKKNELEKIKYEIEIANKKGELLIANSNYNQEKLKSDQEVEETQKKIEFEKLKEELYVLQRKSQVNKEDKLSDIQKEIDAVKSAFSYKFYYIGIVFATFLILIITFFLCKYIGCMESIDFHLWVYFLLWLVFTVSLTSVIVRLFRDFNKKKLLFADLLKSLYERRIKLLDKEL